VKKDDKDPTTSDVAGDMLNALGLKIDMAKLLSTEDVGEQLKQLREKLKNAGGREVLGDEEWRSGETSISRHSRTQGVAKEKEFHIETGAPPSQRKRPERQPRPPEMVEPTIDVFQEPQEIVVVAEVPGVELADLDLKVEKDYLFLTTKPQASRQYRKKINLGCPVKADSLKATSSRGGILEFHLQKE